MSEANLTDRAGRLLRIGAQWADLRAEDDSDDARPTAHQTPFALRSDFLRKIADGEDASAKAADHVAILETAFRRELRKVRGSVR